MSSYKSTLFLAPVRVELGYPKNGTPDPGLLVGPETKESSHKWDEGPEIRDTKGETRDPRPETQYPGPNS